MKSGPTLKACTFYARAASSAAIRARLTEVFPAPLWGAATSKAFISALLLEKKPSG
jgi:hypothetical protein